MGNVQYVGGVIWRHKRRETGVGGVRDGLRHPEKRVGVGFEENEVKESGGE